ncbi:MAG: HsmA family protein [Eubacterium sp.]
MDTKLIMAIVSITLALVFYTVGVWSEHIKKKLKPVHLIMFLLGLVFDTAGTSIMTTLTGNNSAAMVNIHSITGALAIGLMVVHAAWALVVLIKKNEKAQLNFHKFSLLVWIIWLIPYLLGMIIGMMK